jgi:hypothetical protein
MERRKNKIVRFTITNGIPLTTLIAVAYYAGVFAKQSLNIETVHVQLAADVSQIKNTMQQVSTDVAVLKTKVEAVERHHK